MLSCESRGAALVYMQNKGDVKMAAAGYETFEHGADIGIRGWAQSQEQAFAQAALAMFSLIRPDLESISPSRQVFVRTEGYDLESLLVAWLNSLLTQADIQELIFCRFEPRIQGLQLTGWAYGQEYSQDPELQGVEVKGATFNELLVQAQQGLWLAQCVVDV
jgi:SHS2 domain-containing protein